MSTLITVINLIKFAQNGLSFQDKRIAFFLGGLGVIGHHRPLIRSWFRQTIDSCGKAGSINLRFQVNKSPLYLVGRSGNEGDYLMIGELIRGGYEVPPFEPDIIIDGGANIGMFAVQATSEFPNAKVVCYEPDPDNFQVLCRNISLNKLNNVELHQAGLWSSESVLYYHAQTSETGFLDTKVSSVQVSCTLPEIEPNCWLKLDIEGAEYEVLPALFEKGLYPRWISMEIHFFDHKGKKILDLLKQHSYVIRGGEDNGAP